MTWTLPQLLDAAGLHEEQHTIIWDLADLHAKADTKYPGLSKLLYPDTGCISRSPRGNTGLSSTQPLPQGHTSKSAVRRWAGPMASSLQDPAVK